MQPGLPLIILKVGTLDNPSLFGAPQMAIFTVDKQPFHVIPDGLQTFERCLRADAEGDQLRVIRA